MTDEAEIISKRELALRLGVSMRSLERWSVPCYRPSGGRTFYVWSEVLHWMKTNKHEPNTEEVA